MTGTVLCAATEGVKRWNSRRLSRRTLRQAIRAEMRPIVAGLNFFILRAVEPGAHVHELVASRFGPETRLHAFEFYWNERREEILKLPEWTRLYSWHESFKNLRTDPDLALFTAIMLFVRLTTHPLGKCVDRRSGRLVRRTLRLPAVEQYRLDCLLRTSSKHAR